MTDNADNDHKMKDKMSTKNEEKKTCRDENDTSNSSTLYVVNENDSELIMTDESNSGELSLYLLEKLKNVPQDSSLGTIVLHSDPGPIVATVTTSNTTSVDHFNTTSSSLYTISPPSLPIYSTHDDNVNFLPPQPLPLPLPPPPLLPLIPTSSFAIPPTHPPPPPPPPSSSPSPLRLFPSHLFTPASVAWIHMQVKWIVWTFGAYERSYPGVHWIVMCCIVLPNFS